ncbi:hypothetical protein ACF045_11745 [Kocuria rhizophila]|uniref:hypothetical protein n=1 Tax=Bacteria TaxID=2 RepID=UPI00332C1D1F
MEFDDSKKIINGEFDMNRTWYVGFEYKRDYAKKPLSGEENEKLVDDLIQVFAKYEMQWKMK